MASGWRSLSRSERKLSFVTSQSCWELLCSCWRSCKHSLLWEPVGSGAGAGAQPHCEGDRVAPPSGEHTEAQGGHLRASSTPQPWSCCQGPVSLGLDADVAP